MPAYAMGGDVDNIVATFGIARLTITPGDPDLGTPAVVESYADFRRRMVLAPELVTAMTDALAAAAWPAQAIISILSRDGDGMAAPELVAEVEAYLSDETIRPLTDYVTVQASEIVEYEVEATITTFGGPDGGVVLAAARARLDKYVGASQRFGRDITRSALSHALHVEGVRNVTLTLLATDIVISCAQATFCTGITVTHAGVGEDPSVPVVSRLHAAGKPLEQVVAG